MPGDACPRRLAVIGGGYVGLHDAVMAARRGIREIIIVDIDESVVESIESGDPEALQVKDNYILEHWSEVKERLRATTRYSDARGAKVFIVAVQTPLTPNGINYGPLESVARMLPEAVSEGALVSSETTIYPGGTLELLGRPLADTTGLRLDEDILLAHAPERINPGSKRWTPENIPRVIGAVGPKSLEAAVRLYRDCLGLEVHPVSDIRVAEASKLLENAYRFLNIAFVNELKRLLDRAGIDVREVIEAAATKPFGFMPFKPGPYAGGPCIPKDARMLEEFTGSLLLRVARHVNESQPLYYAALILREARRRKARRILFYGLGYKPGAYSAVESPVLRVMESLQELDPSLEVAGYDPRIPGRSDFPSEEEALAWADMVVSWGYKGPGWLRLEEL